MFTTFIKADELENHLGKRDWVIFDCRFWLQEPERGLREYKQAHLPGAIYVDLDKDLSGPIHPTKTGRHPFPDPAGFSRQLGAWGVDTDSQVVAYDQLNGAIAARMWGLLRWLGHKKVAVLEGGWEHWQGEGRPVTGEVPDPVQTVFTPDLNRDFLVDTDFVHSILDQEEYLLVDSRTPERYRGEEEPIDPAAGHIPGAVSLPYPGNLTEQGRLLPKQDLRKRIAAVLGERPPENLIFYCGSGVTSIHNLLVFEYLGMGLPRLYPGSWSAWIRDPGRPIETGTLE